MKKRAKIAINEALSRIFKYKIVSTRALSELITDRARGADEQSQEQFDEPIDQLDVVSLPPNDQLAELNQLVLQLPNQLRRIEMASTPFLIDSRIAKRGKLSFETKHRIFNPTVVKFNDSYIFVTRSTNLLVRLDADYYYTSQPHCSINVVHKLDKFLNPESQFLIDDDILRQRCASAKYGIEDVRLFVWKDSVWGIAAGVGADPYNETSHDFEITQILFRLDDRSIVEFHEIRSPNGSKKEKNWIPLVAQNDLFLIYGIDPYSVFRFDAGQLILAHGVSPKNSYCSIRGSTQFVSLNGKHIGIAHLDREYVDRKHYQRHVFVVLDREMNLEQISEPFFFQRKGLEFACGLSIHDDGLVLSFGVMDHTAEYCILPFGELSRWIAF